MHKIVVTCVCDLHPVVEKNLHFIKCEAILDL